ncbi:C39 family peptidase [Enterocloster clostridioformis]|uniref:Murein hydrolase domain-containing protein n=1 Tax=Enterocloster clostridioformis TaxID=1531 RepID=A0A2X2U8W7_9FIRM|nr:C39 family peptidase [Enterocloster clostridioformis]MCA5577235.1 C39 family peptidase [Enterocloster clostridioformis]SQB10191.1 murein hydrolase domain-containing protein [Enterocloster clostridioformis]
MADEQRNGLSEAFETGASTTYLIHGAVKTGKTVSGAAKGVAAGGPYGAVAGALWEGRKHIGRIAAAVVALLLIPVLFVLMLPGLIFNGFTSAFSPADPETPVLNSETAIIENANTITFTISSILGEGMEDVIKRIERDFAASDGDGMEVINPYEISPIYNANLFVSQYCAAKEKEFADISIADMATVMRRGKSYLYSYQRTEEIRKKIVEDPDTGEETTVSEKWMLYTITYNGEAYFADQVFALTDEQKSLVSDYAQNLSLFLGDGLIQNLEGWEGNSIPSLGNVRFTDGSTEVVYFNQMDERYSSKPYGTDYIGGSGCGPTSMAIVISSLSEEIVDPERMAQWAYENGYWCKGSGSYHALIPGAAAHWGLAVSGCSASEPQRILDALAEGKLVVAIMSKGHFTNGGHFIVLRGVKGGKILVADPGSYKRSGQLWDLSIILNEASQRAGAGGPFWIIG